MRDKNQYRIYPLFFFFLGKILSVLWKGVVVKGFIAKKYKTSPSIQIKFLGISFEEIMTPLLQYLSKIGEKNFAITMIIWFSQLGGQFVPHPSLSIKWSIECIMNWAYLIYYRQS